MRNFVTHWGLSTCIVLLGASVGCDKASPDAQANEASKAPAAEPAPAPAAAAAGAAAPAAGLFTAEIRDRACELLTAEMAAEVLGVEAAALTSQAPVKGWCTWSGKRTGEAAITSITVRDDVDQATRTFNNAYQGMTGAEVAGAMQQIGEKAAEKAAEEGSPVTPGQVQQVGGAVGGALAGGFQYETVPGIGDDARLALSSREIAGKTYYDNDLHVRVRNMTFTVSVAKQVDPPRLLREELSALAKRVVAGL